GMDRGPSRALRRQAGCRGFSLFLGPQRRMARRCRPCGADRTQGRMSRDRRMLPYGRQCIEDDDVAAVAAALRGDFLTTGPKVEEFEQAFARATGARHAVACNSGTAALHLAVLAEELGPGDTAIVP